MSDVQIQDMHKSRTCKGAHGTVGMVLSAPTPIGAR
jgi:hypothetical protein